MLRICNDIRMVRKIGYFLLSVTVVLSMGFALFIMASLISECSRSPLGAERHTNPVNYKVKCTEKRCIRFGDLFPEDLE